MRKINYLRLIISIAICQFAGIIGSLFTSSAIPEWYSDLTKPSFSPPNWIFGPVWVTLYFLMGISLYILWNSNSKSHFRINALKLFIIQLILNALWSIIFFGLKSPGFAFAEIIILWVVILLTIIQSYKFSKTSAYLLIPYILWVTFATVLNLSIYLLN